MFLDHYENLTNPFIEGDKKAKQLANATMSGLSATVVPIQNIAYHVKTEVWDSNDDFDSGDVPHLSSEEVADAFAEDENTEYNPKLTPKIGIENDTTSNQCVIMKIFRKTGIPMKFCSTCEVNFTVKVYDQHKEYLHKKGSRIENTTKASIPSIIKFNTLICNDF